MSGVISIMQGTVAGSVAASNPDAIVSGAGTSPVNGLYTYRGEFGGKPYYCPEGQPDNTSDYAISWNGADTWSIWFGGGNLGFTSSDDVAYPWLATFSVGPDGDSPAPGVASSEWTVVVSGGAAGNGTYTYRGLSNDRAYYNLLGQPNDTGSSALSWNGAEWKCWDGGGNNIYTSASDVAFPWQATWGVGVDGEAPVPTVTQGG